MKTDLYESVLESKLYTIDVVMSPSEFLHLHQTEPDAIVFSRFIPPGPGSGHFGKVHVTIERLSNYGQRASISAILRGEF